MELNFSEITGSCCINIPRNKRSTNFGQFFQTSIGAPKSGGLESMQTKHVEIITNKHLSAGFTQQTSRQTPQSDKNTARNS